MAKIITKKPKIAIFDLTDCEGCELEFVNLQEKLSKIADQTKIANWRFASSSTDLGPFDITFVEGSPITDSDIETLKQARAVSRILITLGTCADLGGVQGVLGQKAWQDGIKDVYGKDYKTKNRAPRPVSYYVDVDYHLPGCPINTGELANFLSDLLVLKKPSEARYPVCLECKANENTCLLLEGQPCLGPITKGGCGAVCPERGLRCWGCFGALRGGNPKALKNLFEDKFGKDRTRQLFEVFYTNQDEFKELYATVSTAKQNSKDKKVVKLKIKS